MKPVCSVLTAGFFILLSTATIASPLELARESRRLAASNQLEPALEKSLQALQEFNQQPNKDHLTIAYVLDDIASLYYRLGSISDAKQYSEQARQKAMALAESPNKKIAIAHISQNKAAIEYATGNMDLAEQSYRKSYQLYDAMPGQWQKKIRTGDALITLYFDRDNLEKADRIIEDNLSMLTENPDHALQFRQYLNKTKWGMKKNRVAVVNQYLSKAQALLPQLDQSAQLAFDEIYGRALLFQSRLPEAEEQFLAMINNRDTNGKADPGVIANAHYYLGFVYILQGKVIEAEPVVLEALTHFRKLVGPKHPVVGRTLHQLAIINKNIGRLAKAESYYLQALDLFEQAFDNAHATIGATRLEYSLLLSHQGKYRQAEQQSREAIGIFTHQAGNELQLGYSWSSLGFVQFGQKKLKSAKASFEKAIGLMESARGKNSADLPPGLIKLAEIAMEERRYSDAEKKIDRAIALLESIEADSPYGLIKAISVKALLMHKKNNNKAARELSNRYLSLLTERLSIHRNSIVNLALEEQREVRKLFKNYIDIGYENYRSGLSLQDAGPLFLASQYPHMTGTSSAMSQVASRVAVKDTRLSDLLRQRNALVEQWVESQQNQVRELAGIGTTSTGVSTQRIQDQINIIDQQLDQDYQSFAELTNPQPIGIKAVQNALHNDEAFLLQVTEDTGTVLFYIDKQTTVIHQTDLTRDQLSERVNAIRHSMDLSRKDSNYANMPRYEVEDSHYLYQKLFQPFEQQLSMKKNLITIVDGAMQNIPPAVLVKTPYTEVESSNYSEKDIATRGFGVVADDNFPDQRVGQIDYRKMDFIGHSIGFSIFPDASSFVALRKLAKKNLAAKPFLGIGDPDLDIPPGKTHSFSLTLDTIGEQLFRHNDPGVLRLIFKSLPETKTELASIARLLGASEKDLILGGRATETTLKSFPVDNYNTISFATHGLLAGEFRGLLEPALVLTPPDQGSDEDNGLLMASEIASLALNADLVILSACNTAGPGGRPGAEGLSGLTKAFFYSGARSLLVSHWAIDSASAVFLTTQMMQHVQDNNLGKAEALQASMRELAFTREPYLAHPAFWSSFVVVGG